MPARRIQQQTPKPTEPKRPLAEIIREHWSEQLELGGSKAL
jgi:hypothetical protein